MNNRMNPVVWLIWLAITLGLSACNNSKNEMPETPVIPEEPEIPQIKNKVFTSDDETSFYLGQYREEYRMASLDPGEKIKVINHGDNKGELIFETDDFDLSTIKRNPVTGIISRPTYFGTGKKASFPMEFILNDDGWSFSGEGTCNLNGIEIWLKAWIGISSIRIIFDYKNVSYFSDFDHGDAKFPPVESSRTFILEYPRNQDNNDYNSSPFITEWTPSSYPESLETKISPSGFLQLLLFTPFIDEEEYGFEREQKDIISPSQLLGRFGSGIWIMSKSFGQRDFDLGLSTVLPCTDIYGEKRIGSKICFGYHYIYDIRQSTFRVTLNPYYLNDIKAPKSSGTIYTSYYPSGTPSTNALFSNIFLSLSQMNLDGILMDYSLYSEPSDRLRFAMTFADKDLSIRFLKSVLLTLLKSEDNRRRLITNLKQNDAIAPYIDDLVYLIDNLDELLSFSTSLKFGWIFSQNAGESSSTHNLSEATYRYLYNEPQQQ